MQARAAGLAIALALAAAVSAAAPAYRQLSAQKIRASVIGKAITDDAHWSDHFLPDGKLDSMDMGRVKRGSWKLRGDELCLTRPGKGGGTDCFEVWISGDAIQYRRDGVVIADGVLRPVTGKGAGK